MAQPVGAPWPTVRQVIDLFVAMGCEPQEFPGEDVVPGLDFQVYYLYSAQTDGIVSLTGFDLDERVAPSTLENWERALGVEVPWGKSRH